MSHTIPLFAKCRVVDYHKNMLQPPVRNRLGMWSLIRGALSSIMDLKQQLDNYDELNILVTKKIIIIIIK